MKKVEFVIREILYNVIEKKNKSLTQLSLAKTLNLSLSTVNLALKSLRAMNAIEVKLKGFVVIDPRKILFYWASARNIEKDIIYKTRVEMPVRKIESLMPENIIYGAYSAYKFKYKDVPADYSEVYIYTTEEDLCEIKKRFPPSNKPANLFGLRKDKIMDEYLNEHTKTTTCAQLFVDLWNLKEWYANDFLKALEKRLSKNGILE